MDGNGAMKSGWQFWIDRDGTLRMSSPRSPTANSSRKSSCRRIRKPIATRRFKVSATSRIAKDAPIPAGRSRRSRWGPLPRTRCWNVKAAALLVTTRLQGPASHGYQARPDLRARDRPARNALRKRGRVPERVLADGTIETPSIST